MRYFAVFVVVSVCAAATHATTYRWFDTNRPQMSLASALELADKALGDEREKYYCINAHLYGDKEGKEGDGKGGFWSLTYASGDGSRKVATVTMQGETHLEKRNGPIDWSANEGRRLNLSDVESRLVTVLESHELQSDKVEKENDEALTLYVSTREFSVHKREDDGSYAASTHLTVGPNPDGVWIRATIVKRPQPTGSPFISPDPYWYRFEHNYMLADGSRFIYVEVRYGRDFPSKVLSQLLDVFGEPLDPW